MYTGKNNLLVAFVLTIILMICLVQPAYPDKESFEFTSSKGLKIKIIKDSNLKYVKAQLLIFQNNQSFKSIIPHLTQMNMFDRYLKNSNSSLLSILRRLGNDFSVEQKQDHLHFQINFLANKFSNFTNFIKELYKYKSFTLKRFNDSIKNYWSSYLSRTGWKKKLARQIAYNYMFPNHPLGNILTINESIYSINLVKLRSYYKKNYLLTNSILIIKGNLNPYISFGLIERELQSFNKASIPFLKYPELNITKHRKIFILPVYRARYPTLFWFEPFTIKNPADYFIRLIINDLIFSKDTGVLIKSRSRNSRSWFTVSSDINNHLGVSVICNSINSSYRNIERIILLADKAINQINTNTIPRKQYFETINYFTGKFKINSSDPDLSLNFEAQKSFMKNFPSLDSAAEKLKTIRISSVKSQIPKKTFPYYNFSINKTGIIVIVGNPELIFKNLNILKSDVQIVNFQNNNFISSNTR